MDRKAISAIMLTPLLIGILALAFDVQSVEANTIQNVNVKDFNYGVYLSAFNDNIVSGNNMTNNNATVQLGIETGDWIKYDYTVTGWPEGIPYPEWRKMEILGVNGTTATVRVITHISDGTEKNQTTIVNVVAGDETSDPFSWFVIPTNCTAGDSLHTSSYGFIRIAGEINMTYAGASRTIVYTTFSQDEIWRRYYWDKATGVMVEASMIWGSITVTAKATETNMWQTAPFWVQLWLWTIIVVAALAGAIYFLKKRRRPATPLFPPENMETTSVDGEMTPKHNSAVFCYEHLTLMFL